MKVTVVMSSGKELDFECENIEVTKDNTRNQLTGLTFHGLKERTFMFVKLDRVDAILIPKEEQSE